MELTRIPPPVTAWLADLVHERISEALTLQLVPAAGWELRVTGSSRRVMIAADPARYDRLAVVLPPHAVRWDPRTEGWTAPLDAVLPVPGLAELPHPVIAPAPDGFHIAFDLLWFALWALSRGEEAASTERDTHDRFPAHASHAMQQGYLDRPLVDEWFAVLREVVQRTWPDLALAQRAFSLAVSHDVDNPRLTDAFNFRAIARHAAREFLHGRRANHPAAGPLSWLLMKAGVRGADPYDRFAWMMQQCEQRGLRSTFHFLCGRTDARFDRSYKLCEPYLRALLQSIHRRGHSIGVHPSYGSYLDPSSILKECDELRHHCVDLQIPVTPLVSRMHYLRWATPATPYALAAAGVTTDYTLGYADQIGFRCNTCIDYQAFDPIELTRINLRIQPLVAMDVTVLQGHYLNLPASVAHERLAALKQKCRTISGCFTLCWHNSELDSGNKRRLFLSILDA